MTVFIELTTDVFEERMSSRAAATSGLRTALAGKSHARRPTRGLEIKDDTYAYIKIIRADGSEVQLVDSSDASGRSTGVSNFIIQNVQDQRMERHQVVETFGDTYLYLFGESPRMLNVSAVLINSLDFNWKAEFEYNYNMYLRGTRAIEQGARCYLFYDDNVVEGYILNCAVIQDAMIPLSVQLQFQFFVTNERNVSLIDNGGYYPIRESAAVPLELDLTDFESTDAESGYYWPSVSSVRTEPLRGKNVDNLDEYVFSGGEPEGGAGDSVVDLTTLAPINFVKLGVSPKAAKSPKVATKLGLQPIFKEGGARPSFSNSGYQNALTPGNSATFGAVPGVSSLTGVGASVGVRVGFGAGVSAGAQLASFAGIGASASAGYFVGTEVGISAGASYVATSYAGAEVYAGVGYSSQTSSAASAGFVSYYERTTTSVYSTRDGFTRTTTRVSGQSSAFASVQSSYQSGSYSYTQAQQTAQAGGYLGYGSSLGFFGGFVSSSASSANQVGTGASVYVGGSSSAFGITGVVGVLDAAVIVNGQVAGEYYASYVG